MGMEKVSHPNSTEVSEVTVTDGEVVGKNEKLFQTCKEIRHHNMSVLWNYYIYYEHKGVA